MKKEFSAGGIILKKNKYFFILLVKNIDDTYGFPKGHVEMGETLVDTVRREIKEEVGLVDVEIKKKIGWLERESIKRNKERVKKRIYLFQVELRKGKTVKDGRDYSWLSLEKAIVKMKYRQDANFLKRYISTLKIE